MQEALDFMKDNSEALMILLTAVYVLTTIGIMLFNRASIKQMEDIKEEDSRPYIYVGIEKQPRDLAIYLTIQNFGKHPGIIKSIKLNPEVTYLGPEVKEGFLEDTVIMPHQKLRLLLNWDENNTAEDKYEVRIEYISGLVNLRRKPMSYDMKYKLSTKYIHAQGYEGETQRSNKVSVEDSLANISEHLHDIRDRI